MIRFKKSNMCDDHQDFFVSIPDGTGTEQIAIGTLYRKDALWGFDFFTSCQRDRTPNGRVRGTNATSVLCRPPHHNKY